MSASSDQGVDTYLPQFEHSYQRWDQLQTEQFSEWVNSVLAPRLLRVENFATDFSNGLFLIAMIEILSGKTVPTYSRNPRILAQKIDNVQNAIQHMHSFLGIKVIGCNPQDIVNGNIKQILGLIFLLSQKAPSANLSLSRHQSRITLDSTHSVPASHPVPSSSTFSSAFSRKPSLPHVPLTSATKLTPVSQQPPDQPTTLGSRKIVRAEKVLNIGTQAALALATSVNLSVQQIEQTQALVRGWVAREVYKVRLAELRVRMAGLLRAFSSSPRALKGLKRVQAKARQLNAAPVWKARVRSKRISAEIISSEETYILALKNLKDKIISPLVEPSLLQHVPAGYHRPLTAIQGSLHPIISINEELLVKLKSQRSKLGVWYWGENVGDVFFQFADYLKQYTFYVNDYNRNLEMFRDLDMTCPEASALFQKAVPECRGLDVLSLLIQPVQRIPRYVMLLSDLLKCNGPQHPHMARLSEARDKMSAIADKINTEKAAAENRFTLMQIQEKCDFPGLMDAHRNFVREGSWKEVMTGGKTRSRYAFLFTDLLLLTKPAKHWRRTLDKSNNILSTKPTFQFQEVVLLEGWHLRDLYTLPPSSEASPRPSRPSTAKDAANIPHLLEFQLMPPHGEGKARTVLANDTQEKFSWMAALDEVQNQLLDQKKSRHAQQPYPVPPVETRFETDVDFVGQVLKRSNKTHEWVRQKLLLKGDSLYIHKSSTPGSAPQLLTNVISCTVRCSAVMDRSNCFEILVTVPLKKNVIFSTDTNAERFEWIRRIRSNIDLLIDAHVKRTKASAKQNAAPSKINDPAIRQILDQPGNNECADCSLPGPEWVCMSRGVFLCSTCGSIHRRLSGQAIISLSRGRWSPEKLRGLQALPGNLLSNELYEKHIPSDVPKPLPTSSNSEKTRFIQLKYTNAADERVERALSIRRDRPRLTDCDLGGTFTFSDSNGSSDASSPSSSLSSSGGGTIVIGSHQARLNSRKQEGLLYKRSAGGNKEFHGVLRTTKLDLYTGADRKKRNSSIPLNLARVLKEPSVDSLTFKIVCPTREYVFSVKAPSELENWISGLSKAIEQLKSHSLR